VSGQPDPAEELKARMRGYLDAWCAERHLDPRGFNFDRLSFEESEAWSLLRGIERQVLPVAEDGTITWPNRHAVLDYFWHGPRDSNPRAIHFARESVVVAGAVADLQIDYGYPPDRIWIETKHGTFDLAVHLGPSESDPMLIAGEAKRSERLADELVAEIRDCARRGAHEGSECPHRQHVKYVGLVRIRPQFLWVLSPRQRHAFEVGGSEDHITLAEVADIPRFEG
jgi:hypothetical protein